MESLKEIIELTYFDNTIWQYLIFFGCILIGVILGKIFYYFTQTKLKKLAQKSSTKFDDYLIDIIEEPLVLVIVTAGFWIGMFFLTLNEAAQKFFDNVILVLLAISLTWFLLRLIDALIKMYVEPLVEKSESRLDDQLLPVIRKFSKTVVGILAVIVILSNLGYDILSILAGLGIGGLALALAAQDAVKNIIGGITIFWDKPFQIDDYIEINGNAGTVDEVGLRSTRLKTVGGTTYVLPNSQVANTMLENFSTRKARRIVVNIGLTYETTAKKMKEAMNIVEDTIKKIEGTRNSDIMIRFVNFGAFSLDLEVVYWITDMSNWKMIINDVNMGIKQNLDNAKIDMAFPTETHYVIDQNRS
jgi:MscS family membrane protein